MYSISDIVQIIGSEGTRLINGQALIQGLSYDSRKISNPENSLFFALTGLKDGHMYVQDAYRLGVRNFVLDAARIDVSGLPEANLIFSSEPLRAMQHLAGQHRRRFNYPVIAITGSNGKTMVKEWLYQLLSPEYRIVRSPKSYNSQLGVALSVWQMDEGHDLAIIEAGISKPGEMEALAAMIAPTIGVLTNIGPAHDEGFKDRAEKLSEKLVLFEHVQMMIYSSGYIPDEPEAIPGKQHFCWGKGATDQLQITGRLILPGQEQKLTAMYEGKELEVYIPFVDAASAENAACCWAVMLALGYEQSLVGIRLANLQPLTMRLELKSGLNNCSVIDDSYSNDLASLGIALDFLKQQQQHDKRILILSDLPETGGNADKVYAEVAGLLTEKGVDQLIGVGPEIGTQAAAFDANSLFFADTPELMRALPSLVLTDATILLKGARKFAFETISKRLTAKQHETSLEINLNAVEHNLNAFRGRLRPGTRLMAMVKAFSYGSGSFEIANLLQFNQVDYLTVAYADEGISLRQAGIDLPIVVMSPESRSLNSLLAHNLEPEIYSFGQLRAMLEALKQGGHLAYGIHLKLNTGMNRLGFEPADLDALLQLVKNDQIRVRSVFSHLVASGNPDEDAFTRHQLALFEDFTVKLRNALGYSFIRHIANTAAIIRWPEAHFDMVRLGIGLYGMDGSHENPLGLQPVATLKTTVAQIRKVKAGESIGYNRHGHLNTDGQIATVKIGYADGYNRRFGNGVGVMMINGQAAPTVGDICMDMCMLDISGLAVAEGDEVIVFGDVPDATTLAESIATIPYELLATVSQRVKRLYYYQ
ncbi:UDP-N-acetylmuramoyl-tripeptide--D-alanyl-D-alanine ligase [bacterium A37T11]|nr:UDP-N-acetylmuramoyl-tripeptide--D-alanyl-D-alanine ligase [bacterium A37T11]